jgi:hypothetical protein
LDDNLREMRISDFKNVEEMRGIGKDALQLLGALTASNAARLVEALRRNIYGRSVRAGAVVRLRPMYGKRYVS